MAGSPTPRRMQANRWATGTHAEEHDEGFGCPAYFDPCIPVEQPVPPSHRDATGRCVICGGYCVGHDFPVVEQPVPPSDESVEDVEHLVAEALRDLPTWESPDDARKVLAFLNAAGYEVVRPWEGTVQRVVAAARAEGRAQRQGEIEAILRDEIRVNDDDDLADWGAREALQRALRAIGRDGDE